GLLEIIESSYFINKVTSLRTPESKEKLLDFLKDKHGTLLPLTGSDYISEIYEEMASFSPQPLSLDFVTGLIDGDGSFNISFQHKPTRRVRANFTVVQETSCRELLNELKTFFGCGNVYDLPSAASYQVNDIDTILNKIVPIFNKVILNTKKNQSYQTMVKVCEIIKAKGYESDENY